MPISSRQRFPALMTIRSSTTNTPAGKLSQQRLSAKSSPRKFEIADVQRANCSLDGGLDGKIADAAQSGAKSKAPPFYSLTASNAPTITPVAKGGGAKLLRRALSEFNHPG